MSPAKLGPPEGIVAMEPVKWATYKGNVLHMTARPRAVGPTTSGLYLYPVTAEYDAIADTTRVGFALVERRTL